MKPASSVELIALQILDQARQIAPLVRQVTIGQFYLPVRCDDCSHLASGRSVAASLCPRCHGGLLGIFLVLLSLLISRQSVPLDGKLFECFALRSRFGLIGKNADGCGVTAVLGGVRHGGQCTPRRVVPPTAKGATLCSQKGSVDMERGQYPIFVRMRDHRSHN
jgi:hypothetical protein